METHVPLQKQSLFNRLAMEKLLRANNSKAAKIQWQSVERISLRENGLPQVVGYLMQHVANHAQKTKNVLNDLYSQLSYF